MTTEHITIGKFILDNLTTGMYNDPLCIYREYIQNAADAIDKAAYSEKNDILKDYEIRITLEPQPDKKRIIVEDNGCGVSVMDAAKTLLSLGDSQKISDRERGFRGIGRLGGIAYCDSLVFVTKSKGDTDESRIEWNCSEIQTLLNRKNNSSRGLEAKDLIAKCVSATQIKSERKQNESFFRVEMTGVRSAKGELLDITQVRSYLEETAPLPFDSTQLFFGNDLDNWLRKEVPDYNTYRIFLNDSLLKKKYTQTLAIHNNKKDELAGYEKISIDDRHGKIIARGWLGQRKENIGTILVSSGVNSLRVRVGNILLGNKSLLDPCFKQDRFNGYLVGEIHITSSALTPNGRRDDLQDSEMKSDFFSGVTKLVVPLEKKAYKDSENKNIAKPIDEAKQTIVKIKKQVEKGFVGNAAKQETLTVLQDVKQPLENLQHKRNVSEKIKEDAEKQIEKIDDLITDVKKITPDLSSQLDGFNRNEKELVRQILDAVYNLYDKSNGAQDLVDRVVQKLKRSR
jgi:molecular chaperone HtpG